MATLTTIMNIYTATYHTIYTVDMLYIGLTTIADILDI